MKVYQDEWDKLLGGAAGCAFCLVCGWLLTLIGVGAAVIYWLVWK